MKKVLVAFLIDDTCKNVEKTLYKIITTIEDSSLISGDARIVDISTIGMDEAKEFWKVKESKQTTTNRN